MGERATDPAHGPALTLLEAVPGDGEGVFCQSSDELCGVPRNSPIRLRFDRLLLPSTAIRQSIRVYTGTPRNPAPMLTPQYDVLSGELMFRFERRLEANVLYTVELLEPELEPFGLRAFDAAPLRERSVPLTWSFMTSSRSDPALDPPVVEREPTCQDVAVRLSAACGGCCHGATEAPMGLRLEQPDQLVLTAINRVARQTETGNTLGIPFRNPARFGVSMPLIDPSNPQFSYLVYKLLLDPDNFAPCQQGCDEFAALPGIDDCRAPSAQEGNRLREWFVRGQPMPLDRARFDLCEPVDGTAAPRHKLDCQSLRVLTRWIENGARCD